MSVKSVVFLQDAKEIYFLVSHNKKNFNPSTCLAFVALLRTRRHTQDFVNDGL